MFAGTFKRLFTKRSTRIRHGGDPGFLTGIANRQRRERIDERTALTIPAYYHGLRLIARTMLGSLDFDVMQFLERGKLKRNRSPALSPLAR
jgi:hypothetical protein